MFVASRYATHKKSSTNVWGFNLSVGASLYLIMDLGHFYFLSDQYFIDFPDPLLMKNHEKMEDEQHDRPCFKAKRVLALQRKGINLIFPEVLSIEKKLLGKNM